MPDDSEKKKEHQDEALRAKLEELKARVESLRERVDALEEKKRGESTSGRK